MYQENFVFEEKFVQLLISVFPVTLIISQSGKVATTSSMKKMTRKEPTESGAVNKVLLKMPMTSV